MFEFINQFSNSENIFSEFINQSSNSAKESSFKENNYITSGISLHTVFFNLSALFFNKALILLDSVYKLCMCNVCI